MSERREEIVQAVIRLIAEKGIQELTMKRIAAEIGITEPAIYRHFASKSEVLSALVDEVVSVRRSIFHEAAEAGEDPGKLLAAFFRGHARLFAERPAMTVVLFSEELFRNDPALSEKILRMMRETRDRIEEIIRSGINSGKLVQNTDSGTASLLLIGGFRLLVSSWYLGGKNFPLPERTEEFVTQALRLLERK
jgi:AcrR family transcriptional regulator